jgi:hypothetical protein
MWLLANKLAMVDCRGWEEALLRRVTSDVAMQLESRSIELSPTNVSARVSQKS